MTGFVLMNQYKKKNALKILNEELISATRESGPINTVTFRFNQYSILKSVLLYCQKSVTYTK